MATELDDDEVKLCNCALCHVPLLGESMRPYLRRNSARRLPKEFADLGIVAGRHKDRHSGISRPYCERCFHSPELVDRRQTDIMNRLFSGPGG